MTESHESHNGVGMEGGWDEMDFEVDLNAFGRESETRRPMNSSKVYVAEREVVQGLDASLGCGCEAVYLLLCEREPIKSRRSISTCEGRIPCRNSRGRTQYRHT